MITPHFFAASSTLDTRATDDNSTASSNLSSGIIILLVLVAAGFAVLMGYSTMRFFYNESGSYWHGISEEQAQYMRDVSQRNTRDMVIPSRVKEPFQNHRGDLSISETGRSSRLSRATMETLPLS